MEEIIGRGLARALREIKEPAFWPDNGDVEKKMREWAWGGAKVESIGKSLEGRDIFLAEFVLGPNPQKTVLFWGYPHPDEPIGAAGLLALGDLALAGKLEEISDWRTVLIPCADPDGVDKQRWLHGDRSVYSWSSGMFRPTQLGIEVDYGFPIDHPPFLHKADYDGACHTEAECRKNHGGPPCPKEGLPWRTLPESIALSRAIERFRPEIISSMHSTHTSGDYTFLLRKESPLVEKDLLEIPNALGTGRHLGEAIDRGFRWREDAPDLIREKTLENHKASLRRTPGFKEGALYAGAASAASFIEALPWRAQFICPETALFRHQNFSNDMPSGAMSSVIQGTREFEGGLYEILWTEESGEWVPIEQTPAKEKTGLFEKEVFLTRGMLGVLALRRRRKVLQEADDIWNSLKNLEANHHLYKEERDNFSIPGKNIGERSMLIFKAREDYRNPATAAQLATFSWIWPMHTLSLLAPFRLWLLEQDHEIEAISKAEKALFSLQEEEISLLPDSLKRESPRAPAMRSQLARVLRLMRAYS